MWKDIKGFEDFYKINEYGDILDKKSGKLMHPYISNKGYKIIDLSNNGIKKKFLVHRLVALHFVPNPNNFPIVLHKDNVKLNTHYSNLVWGTYSENNSQAIRDGLNKIPHPDNRKFYRIYNENSSDQIICHGAKEIISNTNLTNSIVRNILHRKQVIKEGPYEGYKIERVIIKKPLIFY